MDDRLTPEREAQIRQREAEATPGPWTVGETRYIYDENESGESRLWIEPAAGTCPCVKAGSEVVASEILDEDRHGRPLTNAAFIAHARADVPAMLAELDAVRRERDALREAAADACGYLDRVLMDASGGTDMALAVLREALAETAPKE